MEKKLFRLFDFQKFEGNGNLGKIIDETHARCQARTLSLDEMEWVNAAGVPTLPLPIKPEEKDR